jgi:hypothetical protein
VGKKELSALRGELLCPVALAHWIMGDGYYSHGGLVLCTDSFTISDTVLLMNVLMVKFRLECTLRYHGPNKTQPRIYIRKESMNKLRALVMPHMDPSMLIFI